MTQPDDKPRLPLLPTGKPHVSFSEVKCWKECSYRHKLIYIDKIDMDSPSPYLPFGTAVHAGCESLIESKTLDRDRIISEFKEAWLEANFDDPEWVSRQPGWYKHEPVDTWVKWAHNMWDDVLEFLDAQFPGWEIHKAEEQLYEDIEGLDAKFKGFIDGVIKVPNKKGDGHIYWIIDWKTAQSYGWKREKKQDILMTAQLILYKHFWAQKHGVPLSDIRCGFILLKRGAKPGKICELVPVSVGPKAVEKATKILRSMLATVRKGMFLKNRDSCTFCPYAGTQHCL
jgi:hypothetical protein